eukprot:gnl/MRDRNA2_/MRDRNA2_85556_c0_seq1.p1 gnl/MRDRNA2_/MRDRNA2_85556_c0~~gnl/MRDRNA2_/MRDRNA2_85556_c0_seq1.p1  ORF type:complete len:124 (+),score=49.77 gnl/MRDRNA2_/MRDRNA2_85556_c0_seq1:87-458(+)
MQALLLLALCGSAAAQFPFVSMKNKAMEMSIETALDILKNGPEGNRHEDYITPAAQKKPALIESDKTTTEKRRYYGKKIDVKAQEAKQLASMQKGVAEIFEKGATGNLQATKTTNAQKFMQKH